MFGRSPLARAYGDDAPTIISGSRLSLPRAAQRVQEALRSAGFEPEIQVLEDSTRTAPEAAAAVGCELGAIVKTLVFRRADGSPLLALVSGTNRADEARLGEVTRPDAAYVREATGFAIGGVPPVGHTAPIETLVDEDLLAFEQVWCAAGTPNTLFGLPPAELVRITAGRVTALAV
jgi:prolyl-tRNA editing enzyme YbaK/EbsC (Cys-tRNA(Pro) deacylase)